MQQTTIGLYVVPSDHAQDEVLSKLSKLRDWALTNHGIYEWQVLVDGDWVADKSGISTAFDGFIEWVKTAGEMADGEFLLEDDDEQWSTDAFVDIESGELDIDRSFVFDGFQISIFLRTEALYSSEIETFTPAGIGVDGDMNDSDGDYYEFSI